MSIYSRPILTKPLTLVAAILFSSQSLLAPCAVLAASESLPSGEVSDASTKALSAERAAAASHAAVASGLIAGTGTSADADAGTDASTNTSANISTSSDAGVGATVSAGASTSSSTRSDAGVGATVSAGANTSSSTSADAGVDATVSAGANTSSSTSADAGVDAIVSDSASASASVNASVNTNTSTGVFAYGGAPTSASGRASTAVSGGDAGQPLDLITRQIARKEIELLRLNTSFRSEGTRVSKWKPWRLFVYNLGASGCSEAGITSIAATRWHYWTKPKTMPRSTAKTGPILLLIGHCITLGGVLTESSLDLVNDHKIRKKGMDAASTEKQVLALKGDLDRLLTERESLLASL